MGLIKQHPVFTVVIFTAGMVTGPYIMSRLPIPSLGKGAPSQG